MQLILAADSKIQLTCGNEIFDNQEILHIFSFANEKIYKIVSRSSAVENAKKECFYDFLAMENVARTSDRKRMYTDSNAASLFSSFVR